MHYVYFDFETAVSERVRLKRMTLRQYLAQSHILGLAVAVDDAPVQFWRAPLPEDLIAELKRCCLDPDTTFVAHNAAFDVRVLRHVLGCDQPSHVHCTLELSCAAFPNQPGGYSLANLARTLNLGAEKLGINLEKHTPEELATYCKSDVELCRSIHRVVLPRIIPDEIRIAELCNTTRELWFDIDTERVTAALTDFTAQSTEAVLAAMTYLGEGAAKGFGLSDAELAERVANGAADETEVSERINAGTLAVKSVKPHVVKDLLLDNLGFAAQSISRKKINPEKLRANAQAANVIASVEAANKAMSNQRRVRVFQAQSSIDAEFGYFRAAATGRFSSPQPGGKGLNLHNLNKRNKRIAKALRSIFRFPEGFVAVRGDFANVEYRIEGVITGCEHIRKLFEANPFADPYLGFGNQATGRNFTKADPIRQVFKAAVLGLGYLMSHYRFTEELLKAIADPDFKVSLDDLKRVCADMKWTYDKLPSFAKSASTRLRCPQEFATVAFYMRERFHEIHPEFQRTARWVMNLLGDIIRSVNPERTIERAYESPNAPPREHFDVRYAGDKYGRGTKNVEVYLCGWKQPTVVWRDLAMRECLQFGEMGIALTAVHATKGFRPVTANIAIENPSQSAARNAVVKAHLALQERGYPYQLSVHDEVMLVVPQTTEAVRKAYDDLLAVTGPGNALGFNWAVLVDPKEVSCTKTLYEVPVETLLPPIGEKDGKPVFPPPSTFWDHLTPELLAALP